MEAANAHREPAVFLLARAVGLGMVRRGVDGGRGVRVDETIVAALSGLVKRKTCVSKMSE
jgi:hypothetical protein